MSSSVFFSTQTLHISPYTLHLGKPCSYWSGIDQNTNDGIFRIFGYGEIPNQNGKIDYNRAYVLDLVVRNTELEKIQKIVFLQIGNLPRAVYCADVQSPLDYSYARVTKQGIQIATDAKIEKGQFILTYPSTTQDDQSQIRDEIPTFDTDQLISITKI